LLICHSDIERVELRDSRPKKEAHHPQRISNQNSIVQI